MEVYTISCGDDGNFNIKDAADAPQGNSWNFFTEWGIDFDMSKKLFRKLFECDIHKDAVSESVPVKDVPPIVEKIFGKIEFNVNDNYGNYELFQSKYKSITDWERVMKLLFEGIKKYHQGLEYTSERRLHPTNEKDKKLPEFKWVILGEPPGLKIHFAMNEAGTGVKKLFQPTNQAKILQISTACQKFDAGPGEGDVGVTFPKINTTFVYHENYFKAHGFNLNKNVYKIIEYKIERTAYDYSIGSLKIEHPPISNDDKYEKGAHGITYRFIDDPPDSHNQTIITGSTHDINNKLRQTNSAKGNNWDTTEPKMHTTILNAILKLLGDFMQVQNYVVIYKLGLQPYKDCRNGHPQDMDWTKTCLPFEVKVGNGNDAKLEKFKDVDNIEKAIAMSSCDNTVCHLSILSKLPFIYVPNPISEKAGPELAELETPGKWDFKRPCIYTPVSITPHDILKTNLDNVKTFIIERLERIHEALKSAGVGEKDPTTKEFPLLFQIKMIPATARKGSASLYLSKNIETKQLDDSKIQFNMSENSYNLHEKLNIKSAYREAKADALSTYEELEKMLNLLPANVNENHPNFEDLKKKIDEFRKKFYIEEFITFKNDKPFLHYFPILTPLSSDLVTQSSKMQGLQDSLNKLIQFIHRNILKNFDVDSRSRPIIQFVDNSESLLGGKAASFSTGFKAVWPNVKGLYQLFQKECIDDLGVSISDKFNNDPQANPPAKGGSQTIPQLDIVELLERDAKKFEVGASVFQELDSLENYFFVKSENYPTYLEYYLFKYIRFFFLNYLDFTSISIQNYKDIVDFYNRCLDYIQNNNINEQAARWQAIEDAAEINGKDGIAANKANFISSKVNDAVNAVAVNANGWSLRTPSQLEVNYPTSTVEFFQSKESKKREEAFQALQELQELPQVNLTERSELGLEVASRMNYASTLDVTKATSLASTLNVTKATSLESTLDVTGAATVTGATVLASTLDVTKATSLASTLNVTKATSLESTLDVTGATNVTGATVLASTPPPTPRDKVKRKLERTPTLQNSRHLPSKRRQPQGVSITKMEKMVRNKPTLKRNHPNETLSTKIYNMVKNEPPLIPKHPKKTRLQGGSITKFKAGNRKRLSKNKKIKNNKKFNSKNKRNKKDGFKLETNTKNIKIKSKKNNNSNKKQTLKIKKSKKVNKK